MFEKISVSEEQVLSTLREVVAERPDYVYSRPEHFPQDSSSLNPAEQTDCLYVHPGKDESATPGCVVGQVLHRLGVPLEELSLYEGDDAASVTSAVLDTASSVYWVLFAAQWEQDSGETWGAALAAAERKVVELATD
ncbi:hypothetical protein [Streptomyces decoyicus]